MPRISARLLKWYRDYKRSLPWRGRRDAYAIWVSEVMLQQTRVETVIPYFKRWMRLFPNVRALALASEQEVLNAWEGLGYYSRARNLHKAAKIVVKEHGGKIPRDLDELRKLPGIGRYTLGAIASIAFELDVPALDGNIKRVYARLFDLSEPVDSPGGEKKLWNLVEENLPRGRAGDYNQALMDLGAMICIPKKPRCPICPLRGVCLAYENGTQEARPVKKPKRTVPHHTHVAAVIIRAGRVLLSKRPSEGLLGGMWEFPNGRVDSGGENQEELAGELPKALKTGCGLVVRASRGTNGRRPLAVVQHAYTHFKVTVHAFRASVGAVPRDANVKWVPVGELENYPMGRIDRQIARTLQESFRA